MHLLGPNQLKAITREPYHFGTPEDIAHLLDDVCIMTVCDCKKGYWHQKLDEASSVLTTFNTDIGRFRYTVMPLGFTVAGDVFQHKLHQCFGKIDQVIVITDDIMIVGKKQNHRDHDIALTTLLETARKCNVKLNFDKPQYKKTEVDFVEAWYSLEQYIGLKEDKLSSTTVDFIRSEWNLETKRLYWFSKPKVC